MSKLERSKSFVPQLLLALGSNPKLEIPFSSLPESYQKQPYNLAAKITKRHGMNVRVNFNKANDIFIITKI